MRHALNPEPILFVVMPITVKIFHRQAGDSKHTMPPSGKNGSSLLTVILFLLLRLYYACVQLLRFSVLAGKRIKGLMFADVIEAEIIKRRNREVRI